MNDRHNNLSRGIRVLIADDPTSFEEIFAVEDLRAAEQAFALAEAFGPAVGADGRFDLAEAVRIAEADPKLGEVSQLNVTLAQTDDDVGRMVGDVEQVLEDFLGVALAETQQEQISAAVHLAFTNLDTQSADAWIFWEESSGHSTTYQYNILFAIQNEATGDDVLGLPFALTITVDVAYKRVLFITVTDRASYTVHVEALKVATPFEAALRDAARAARPGRVG